MKNPELLKIMKNAIMIGEIGKKKLIEKAGRLGIVLKNGDSKMETKYKLVTHPTLKVLGYFKENGEFVQVVDKTEGGGR